MDSSKFYHLDFTLITFRPTNLVRQMYFWESQGAVVLVPFSDLLESLSYFVLYFFRLHVFLKLKR